MWLYLPVKTWCSCQIQSQWFNRTLVGCPYVRSTQMAILLSTRLQQLFCIESLIMSIMVPFVMTHLWLVRKYTHQLDGSKMIWLNIKSLSSIWCSLYFKYYCNSTLTFHMGLNLGVTNLLWNYLFDVNSPMCLKIWSDHQKFCKYLTLFFRCPN